MHKVNRQLYEYYRWLIIFIKVSFFYLIVHSLKITVFFNDSIVFLVIVFFAFTENGVVKLKRALNSKRVLNG